MLKLSRIIKSYAETGALNENISVFGFLDEHTFLTKAGDVGVVLRVEGVDYECLDSTEVDNLTKRLEAAFKLFYPKFRVYQYLFKSNHPTIPYTKHENPIVQTAIEDRLRYFENKSAQLYSVEIYYVILFEGFRYKTSVVQSAAKLFSVPNLACKELRALFSTEKQAVLVLDEIETAQNALQRRVENFILQLNDFVQVELLDKKEAFRVLRKLVNVAPQKRQLGGLKYDTHADYFMADSAIECYPHHLLLDDYYVRILTLREPTAQSWPLILKQLYEVEANYHVVSEWRAHDNTEVRKKIQSARRHFHNSKTSLMSQIKADGSPHAADVLVDDSKESLVQSLGECLKEIEIKGNYFGEFSLTIVVYDRDRAAVDKACADFYKVFSMHDGTLFEERYNLLNAFFATIPGNYHFNLRGLELLNTNYADYSFLFTLHTGEQRNRHLDREYLAILETNHNSPYFLNLHYLDTAHSVVFGRTGSGKSFLLNFLITNLQKYDPYTFIFDLGGSFESLTQLFGGSYVRVGLESEDFKINPFSLPPTKENLDFLALFLKVLIQGQRTSELDPAAERELFHQVENLYAVDPALRTLGVLANTLGHDIAGRLSKWTRGGQFGFLFDNAEDTISFSRFQCFDFQRMSQYPELLEPLLFYILHRANAVIADRQISSVFKAFFIDEAWMFLKNPSIQRYVVEALKTWRKHNAAMILSTQSLDELRRSDILDIIIESCATKIFLANPDMDRELYRRQFHLNDNEVELISTLIPKQQFLIKTPELAKIANLNVDPKSYWLYTNDPFDNQKRKEAFETYGFVKGLEVLAGGKS